jgi:hypothetical protein
LRLILVSISQPNRPTESKWRARAENGQTFLALIVQVPLHLPTNESVPVNDFFAG